MGRRWTRLDWTGAARDSTVIVILCVEYYSLFWRRRWSPKGRHPQRETKQKKREKSEIWPDGGKANINLAEGKVREGGTPTPLHHLYESRANKHLNVCTSPWNVPVRWDSNNFATGHSGGTGYGLGPACWLQLGSYGTFSQSIKLVNAVIAGNLFTLHGVGCGLWAAGGERWAWPLPCV